MHEAPEQEIVSNQPPITLPGRAEETPYTSVKVITERTPMSRHMDIPRRVQHTREDSQEDALASARHVFAPGNGQNQAMLTESPEEVPITTTGGATVETSTLTIISTFPTTSTTTTAAGIGMGSSSPFLPNGSPSRPTATAICRPWTWIQRISEGCTGTPPLDDTESGESDLHVPPSSAEEEVPENLGYEWRVSHPFKLLGVRYPTDATPPNHRRLAENGALVALIQATEYLEDIPMWGQRDYQLYRSRYGDPFYRGRGRGRSRQRREIMNERSQERDST